MSGARRLHHGGLPLHYANLALKFVPAGIADTAGVTPQERMMEPNKWFRVFLHGHFKRQPGYIPADFHLLDDFRNSVHGSRLKSPLSPSACRYPQPGIGSVQASYAALGAAGRPGPRIIDQGRAGCE